MEADDAALARALMMEEMAAADAAGIDYSPTFRKRRRDSTSDDDFDPTRRKASKATKPQAPKPEPPPKPKPAPKPRARPEAKPKEVKASFVARGVTLAHLIDARLIAPGQGAVSTTYNDVVRHADAQLVREAVHAHPSREAPAARARAEPAAPDDERHVRARARLHGDALRARVRVEHDEELVGRVAPLERVALELHAEL